MNSLFFKMFYLNIQNKWIILHCLYCLLYYNSIDLIFFLKIHISSKLNIIFMKKIIFCKWLIRIYVLKYYCLYNDVKLYGFMNTNYITYNKINSKGFAIIAA